jgi:SAM-dependent methyltransferase
MRVNIGCGGTPTDGWRNFDNSLTIRLARWPGVTRLFKMLNFRNGQASWLGRIAIDSDIHFADATVRIPCPDRSVEVVYSSHMIEHLDRSGAQAFVAEIKRVLRPGGIVRLAAPDLALLVQRYVTSGDADDFVAGTHMGLDRPVGMIARAKLALVGPRHHLWMYDGASLTRLLAGAGFTDIATVPPGETRIPEPGGLNLSERVDESVYIEAFRSAEL